MCCAVVDAAELPGHSVPRNQAVNHRHGSDVQPHASQVHCYGELAPPHVPMPLPLSLYQNVLVPCRTRLVQLPYLAITIPYDTIPVQCHALLTTSAALFFQAFSFVVNHPPCSSFPDQGLCQGVGMAAALTWMVLRMHSTIEAVAILLAVSQPRPYLMILTLTMAAYSSHRARLPLQHLRDSACKKCTFILC